MKLPVSTTRALLLAVCIGMAGRSDTRGGDIVAVTPFPSQQKAQETPLFAELPSTETGMTFAYSWNPSSQYDHELVNAVTGGGVCLGDYDGDGLVDLFLTQPFGGNRLYRNLGKWKFQDVTDAAGLTKETDWGTGASFADIDNDGDLDLYVCGYDVANRLYVNQGNGTFLEKATAAGVDYRGASIMIAFADYDLDGDLDAYLCNNHIARKEAPIWKYEKDDRGMPIVPKELKGEAKALYRPDIGDGKLIPAGESDILYQNNGDGTFTNVSTKAGIADEDFGLSATWWDFDHDGDPDLYNANDFYGADHLYRNNGDGTFTNVNKFALPHTPWFSMGSDVADINNDGWLDFMASDMQGSTHFKQKISMGDMQGWFLETAVPRQYMRNALYINTGDLRFQEGAFLAGVASTDWTWSLKFADLDSDGREDLYVTNGAERYWDHSDMMKATRGAQRIDTPELKNIWLPSPVRNDPNLAYRNLGDLEFEDVSASWGLGAERVSYGAALGDLDGDGDLDLVVNNFDREASLYQNNSTTNQRAYLDLQSATGNRNGLGALVRIRTSAGQQAKYHTLTRGFMSANAPGIAIGLGNDRSFDLTIEWPGGNNENLTNLKSGHRYLIKEKKEKPRKTVIPPRRFVISDALRKAAVKERPFDDYAREPLLPHKLSQAGPGQAWGDLDGDGDDDLVLGAPAGKPTTIHLTGPGSFTLTNQPSLTRDAAHEDGTPLLLDVEGDGDLDLLVTSGSTEAETGDALYRDRLYLNDGSGTMTRAPEGHWPDLRFSSHTAVAADFDRDGDLDVFVGTRIRPGQYPLSDPSALLVNDQGRFTNVIDKTAPGLADAGLVTGALWSDADGDGWIDLWITREWGTISLWRNEKGNLKDVSKSAGLGTLSGWWNGIAGGDLNHDGAIDYVVTNTGLNTKYHADPAHPARLYYGDMDGSGRAQIIEAKMEGDTWLPIRGKSCSQNAMPGIKNRFPTFKAFAGATLTEIYTPIRLEKAQSFNATELQSGTLLNDGKGNFTFHPLPRIAQISAGFGIALTEINGDGHPDLYIVQNDFSPQAETGRFDGGVSQLLMGKGDGTFTPVPTHESGLLVTGDGKSLGHIDLNRDGWVDFVAATNSGPILTFINRGDSTHRPLSFRVVGPAGNPTAIGTRLTLAGKGMPRQTAEIHGGGGYLSQQSGSLFFGVPSGGQPVALVVHWPDGSRSNVNLTKQKGKRLEIRHPSLKR